MKIFSQILIYIIFVFSFYSCATYKDYYKRNTFNYPDPVDTQNKRIKLQEKKEYHSNGVYADNMFDAARMNSFEAINDSTYQITIEPENFPINDSPWFSFRIWSDTLKQVYIKIKYLNGKHRYIPKISHDRVIWTTININELYIENDRNSATFPLIIDRAKTWISAQEIINSNDVLIWMDSLKGFDYSSDFEIIGKSNLGRDIPYFRIGNKTYEKKEVIVLLSRQHPPEISGFLALQSYIEELLNNNDLTFDFFSRYEIWVFPLLNPDGVDLGHWRHNANGVDMNRDWAYYRQTEIDLITKNIVDRAKKNKSRIILGLDFHSTQKDIFYVFDDSFDCTIVNFKKYWTSSIDRVISPFKSVYSPSPLTKPY